MQRGTLLFMASEQLPRKHHIKQAKQEDLMKVDIWQLGITLFCLVNPGLNAPFDIDSREWQIYLNFQKSLLQNNLNAGNLPAMSSRYYFQWQLYWNQIYDTYRMCSQLNPGDQPSLEDVRACIAKIREKTTNHPVTKPQH